MQLTTHGAAGGEVTGSAYLLETTDAAVLIDYGMFQGGKEAEERNRVPTFSGASTLKAVVVTHGHLDHTGRLPLLFRAGYRGPIYCTPATAEMTALILRDSAKIQAQDNERINRKRQRAGDPPMSPLYTIEDVEGLLGLLKPVEYHTQLPIAPGITAFFAEAGHMLGSASVLLTVADQGRSCRIVFSGDLGPKGAPILRDYEPFDGADVVLMESTYGDHDHRPFQETVEEFFRIVREAFAAGGKILVPTFAVGRAQLLTWLMAWAFRNNVVPPFPIYLDSPMALEASRIYQRHEELFDDDLRKFLVEGSITDDLATFHASATADDSRKINDVEGSCLVMAGAGMCTAGRILHHLKQNLWRPETHVVIVGYQAHGTLGRMLVEGVKTVKIFGEKIAVRARVHTLGGFSAHAGKTDLIAWFKTLAKSSPRVLLTHGEDKPRQELARVLRAEYGVRPELPALGETVQL